MSACELCGRAEAELEQCRDCDDLVCALCMEVCENCDEVVCESCADDHTCGG